MNPSPTTPSFSPAFCTAPILQLEAPDTVGVVSFLDANVVVRVTVTVGADGVRHLEVEALAANGENSSEFRTAELQCEFPAYEQAEPSFEVYAVVRLPLDQYGPGVENPELHQEQYPHLTLWRDAIHDGRRVDGLYLVAPDRVWSYGSSAPRFITLTLVGVEIEWPEELDEDAREAIHECEDNILALSRELDYEYVEAYSEDLFSGRGVWRPDVTHADLGVFSTVDEAQERWATNPPMVPIVPPQPAEPALETT